MKTYRPLGRNYFGTQVDAIVKDITVVRLIIASMLLATHLLSHAALAEPAPVQKTATVRKNRHVANKTSYDQSKSSTVSMSKEEQQIMGDRNKADGKPLKNRSESAYDKARKSVDEYIYGKSPRRKYYDL
ncbi:MAG TPA: hypothetical protein VIH45_03525 [Desulfuromonadaceae bacterium]